MTRTERLDILRELFSLYCISQGNQRFGMHGKASVRFFLQSSLLLLSSVHIPNRVAIH